jgi:hypothetical protein
MPWQAIDLLRHDAAIDLTARRAFEPTIFPGRLRERVRASLTTRGTKHTKAVSYVFALPGRKNEPPAGQIIAAADRSQENQPSEHVFEIHGRTSCMDGLTSVCHFQTA